MRPLRIAFMVPSFPTLSETFIYNQIAYLLKQGHDVQLFAYNRSREKILHTVIQEHDLMARCTYYPTGLISRGKRVVLHTLKRVMKATGLFASKKLSHLEWERITARYKTLNAKPWFRKHAPFDIIHVHHGIVGVPIAAMLAGGHQAQPKLVVSFHGYDLDPSRHDEYKALYSKLFNVSDALTVNSPYLRGILQAMDPTESKIQLLPVGIDTRKFSTTLLNRGRDTSGVFRVVFCGRLIPLKGPDLAIEIIRAVVHTENITHIQLDIFGDGPLFSLLSSMIKQYRLEKHVHLHGSVSQENWIGALQKSHLLLMPGIYDPETGRAETQGLVIQEAQSMGLPVLVSDAGGMQYGMVNEETGFVLEAGNIQAFASKIAYLYHHEEERQSLCLAARAFVTANYDIGYLGNKLESIYQQIIADHENLSSNSSGIQAPNE